MEWDAAVLEAALHELDHLRHGRVPEASDATPRPTHERSLLDTNDAGLSHADGGVMSTTHEHGRSLGPSVVTIVPDTNVLVHEGGASLDRLLGRFRARIGADGSVTRARVAVPRKVVQELDGLKTHAGGAGSGTGDRRSEVAALARSVNRALERRLIGAAQTRSRRRDAALDERDAELLVQGPADAGAMRVRMRAEGLERGGDERSSTSVSGAESRWVKSSSPHRRRQRGGHGGVRRGTRRRARLRVPPGTSRRTTRRRCSARPGRFTRTRRNASAASSPTTRPRGGVGGPSPAGREPGKAGVSSPRRGLHRPAPRPPRAAPSVTTPRLSREEEDRRGRDPPPTAAGFPQTRMTRRRPCRESSTRSTPRFPPRWRPC